MILFLSALCIPFFTKMDRPCVHVRACGKAALRPLQIVTSESRCGQRDMGSEPTWMLSEQAGHADSHRHQGSGMFLPF